jgi:hypothetical protein
MLARAHRVRSGLRHPHYEVPPTRDVNPGGACPQSEFQRWKVYVVLNSEIKRPK